MAKLPLDYLSEHFTRPLARFVCAEDSYDFAPLRISQRTWLMVGNCGRSRAADLRRASVSRLHPLVVPAHLCVLRNDYTFQSLYPHRQLLATKLCQCID